VGISQNYESIDMKMIIIDTNVFFDIIGIGVLSEFFSLDFEICTTAFVIKEIIESDQKAEIELFIRANKVTVFRFSPDEIELMQEFKTSRNFKGITDKSVLWKSFELQCPLLTGDKKLRKEAEELNIEVHGSIWVVSTLVEMELIQKSKAIELFEKLKLINSSLPFDEIDKLIRSYKR